jgi:hypothetical protein
MSTPGQYCHFPAGSRARSGALIDSESLGDQLGIHILADLSPAEERIDHGPSAVERLGPQTRDIYRNLRSVAFGEPQPNR